ncbi:HAMP domain-containing histidine kinase [Aestuariibacter sp. AA17]|uniref:histidine kinase n=1 Tax=Fluctibacter corallii TaxID=2984329 RepID=A0ABT3A3U1_9ALTE|nr:HAMP domain-containing histidine kinase [Aestuariibacter sp. AA17]
MTFIAGVFAFYSLFEIRKETLSNQVQRAANEFTADLNRQIGANTDFTQQLYSEISYYNLIRKGEQFDGEELANVFANHLARNPTLYQLRWLDEAGNEKLKVIKETSGKITRLANDALVNKGHRDYMQAAKKLNEGEVYHSAIDLNVEYGKIERPHRVTMRGVIYTGHHGLLPGYLVANFQLNNIMRKAYSTSALLYLTARDGYWLKHPDKSKEWGSQLSETDANAIRDVPDLWQFVNTKHSGSIVQAYGKLWQILSLKTELNNINGELEQNLFVLSSTTEEQLASLFKNTFLLVAFPTMLVLVYGIWSQHKLVKEEIRQLALNEELRDEKRQLVKSNRELEKTLKHQRSLQDELVETRKLSSLGMMVAGIAHELNTPIGSAMMSVSTLQDRYDSLAERLKKGVTKSALDDFLSLSEDALDSTMRNLYKSADMIQSFKRLALDRTSMTLEDIHIHTIINDLIVMMYPHFELNSVKIAIQCDEATTLKTYPGILSQILQNLVENALHHAFPDGQKGKLQIAAKKERGLVHITVSDDGVGISQDIKENIFDPFVTTKRGEGNTGLGMHLVHQWTTQILKGRIYVEPMIQGARFVLILPSLKEEDVNGTTA